MRQVLVVQPYVAQYRVPFWERVRTAAKALDIDVTLAYGRPDRTQSMRGDQATVSRSIDAPTRSFRIGDAVLRWQGTWSHFAHYDAVVMEASAGLLDASVAVASRTPTLLWGHIENYISTASVPESILERWQLRRANAVLAYTESGLRRAVSFGVPGDRITVLNNTVDTTEVISLRRALTRERAAAMLGVGPDQRFVGFVGGLDAAKQIDVLKDSFEAARAVDPTLHLIVAGQGADLPLLSALFENGWATHVGYADAGAKAAIGVLADALLCPGRVGLLAVESFAMGVPIVTRNLSPHAPEFDYLVDGADSILIPGDEGQYVRRVAQILDPTCRDRLDGLAALCDSKAGWPSIDDMADSFVQAVSRVLESTGTSAGDDS